VKQEVQVVDHHREETLLEEDLHPEEEAEQEKFDVIHVENGGMDHGTILIIKQQIKGMSLWKRQGKKNLK